MQNIRMSFPKLSALPNSDSRQKQYDASSCKYYVKAHTTNFLTQLQVRLLKFSYEVGKIQNYIYSKNTIITKYALFLFLMEILTFLIFLI